MSNTDLVFSKTQACLDFEAYRQVQSAAVRGRIQDWAYRPTQKRIYVFKNDYLHQACSHKAEILTDIGLLQRNDFIWGELCGTNLNL